MYTADCFYEEKSKFFEVLLGLFPLIVSPYNMWFFSLPPKKYKTSSVRNLLFSDGSILNSPFLATCSLILEVELKVINSSGYQSIPILLLPSWKT